MNLKAQQLPVILDLCLGKIQPGKSNYNRGYIVFEKISPFSNCFLLHTEIKKLPFSNSSSLTSVFEKLRIRDGIM